jgi:uncharacterized repeat protein (TIGR02543 family)
LALALVLIASAGFFILNSGSTDADGHTHDNITFIEWTSSTSLPDKEGSYYLANDVTLTSSWNVPSGATDLCLNGHSITMHQSDKTSDIAVITIGSGNTLNLYDCSDPSSGKITHYSEKTGDVTVTWKGLGVHVLGAFNMYGGTISGNSSDLGGGVYVCNEGTFKMYGGTISSNTAKVDGGGVYNEGTFSMDGGTISQNTATTNGGGVYNEGTFSMDGGTISKNTATEVMGGGGGVYNKDTFKMSGGTISNNNANNGGGVFNTINGTFKMSGGTISKNTATTNGGGVYNNGTFNMYDGTISKNTATDGAGVFTTDFDENDVFNMYGGTVSNNTATESGGGVYVFGTFNMSGGTISNNSASSYGGGVRVSESDTLSIQGSPVISCNFKPGEQKTPSNVFLPDSKNITINGPITNGARIGITTGNAGDLTTGYKTKGNSCDPACWFFSDDKNKGITWMGDSPTEAKLISGDKDHLIYDGIAFMKISNLPDSAGSYYLDVDVTLTSTWAVPSGTTNLCLNGKSITMKQDTDTDNVPVISVGNERALNLYDCSNPSTGKITHYSKTTDNNTETWMGKGLEVSGTFNMYGGTISGNTNSDSQRGGGGVDIDGGAFNMYGGTISGNRSSSNGGGVFIDHGTFSIEGLPVISGNLVSNKSDNIYLSQGVKIKITNALTKGADIGISMESSGIFTDGYSTYNNDDPKTFFKSDDPAYAVSLDSNTEAKLFATGPTVTFDGNGSTSGSMMPQSFTSGVEQNLTANAFARTGYSFTKWSTNQGGGGTEYTDGQSITITSSITLYAQWTANHYTVHFEDNGSTSGEMADQTFTYGTAQDLTTNAFARTGYTFIGWNTDSTATTAQYTDGQNVNNLTPVKDATVKLYAIWSENKLTVTFYGNGSTSGEMADQTIKYTDATKTLTANAFKKTGKIFTGWNTAQDGTGESYANCADVSALLTSPGGTLSLYAQWGDPTPCTVTISEPTGGSITPKEQFQVTNGTWTVNGSTMTITGTNFQTELTIVPKQGYAFKSFTIDDTPVTGTGDIIANITVSAVMLTIVTEPHGQALTYNGEEQTGVTPYETDKITFIDAQKTAVGNYDAKATPKDGYCWDANCDVTTKNIPWSIEKATATVTADDKTKIVGADDPELTATVTGLFGQDALVYQLAREAGEDAGTYTITPSGDAEQGNYHVNYVAGILKIQFQVTFDVQGHGTAPDNQSVDSGAKVVKPDDPSASGYAFGGWFKEAGCTNVWNFETDTVTANTTLYAKWTPAVVKHHVTYDANGGSAAAPVQEDVIEGQTFKVASYSGTKSGYTFGGWTYGGQTYQPGYEMTMGTSDIAFKAKWNATPAPTTKYTVTITAGTGGSVSKGSVTVDSGTSISAALNMLRIGSTMITATPSDGYEFDSWSGITSSTVKSDMDVTANFKKQGEKTYSISYSLGGGSWKEGYVAPSKYTEGVGTSLPSASDINAYAKDGYTVTFLGWYLSSDKSKTIVTSITSTDKGDKSFTTLWEEKINYYAYNVNYQDASGKTIAPSYRGTAEFGSKVTPDIIPVTGYIPPKETKTIVISSDESKNTITYVYTVTTFTITVTQGSHGTITGPRTVDYGADAIFAITGDDDYVISDVIVDGTSVGKKGIYTFTSVNSDHSISASFEYKKNASTDIDDTGNVTETYTDEQDGKDVNVAIHYNANGKTESYASVSVSDDTTATVSVVTDADGKTVIDTTALISSDATKTITLEDLNEAKEAAASAAKSLDVDANDKMNIVVDSTTESGSSKGASISFEGVSSGNTLAITVLGDAGSISFDSKVIADVLKTASAFNVVFEEADDSSITPEQRRAAGDNTVYDIFAVVNGKTMTTFDGEVKISMPYELKEEEEPTDVKIYYVSDEGNVELIGGNWSNGYVTAKLSHFSDYFAAADYVLRNVTLEKTGEGSVEASTYSCSPGTTVKLTATPSDGWKFVKWESQQVTVTEGSFVMPDEDVTVKAVFEKASGSSSGFDWWWIPIIVAVVACIAGGIWFYNRRKA